MAVGAAAQTVQVSGEDPVINTTSGDFATVVDQMPLKSLPENNYRWSAFALLTPGVTNDSNGYGLLSFRGQSTLLNNVTIDGTDDNQAFFAEERGRTRAGYSTIKAAVQEFQDVLNADPNNISAIDGIGSILFNMAGTLVAMSNRSLGVSVAPLFVGSSAAA